jgi:hypothetical protein
MGSAALAVTIAAIRAREFWLGYLVLTFVFGYTILVNIIDRPEGIKIASIFIVSIVFTSLVSRVMRSTELRMHSVEPDPTAVRFIKEAGDAPVRILASRPGDSSVEEYVRKLRDAREAHHLAESQPVLFLEVRPGDASEFTDKLEVEGVDIGGHHVLRAESPAIPNAIAALLLHIRDQTGKIPHAYFGWTEGNPVTYLLKFLAFGEGDTAPVTREVLRQAEPNPLRRPRVHVG